MNPVTPGALRVTSFEEVACGLALVAITMTMHGFGMIATLRTTGFFKERIARFQSFFLSIGVLILASGMILTVHLLEVIMWGLFFLWRGGMPNANTSFYFALMDYTTVGSIYNLPLRMRLLEGVLAMAGLLTFAWSTGILLTLAQDFQDWEMQRIRRRRGKASQQTGS